jgi:hypothetical protein
MKSYREHGGAATAAFVATNLEKGTRTAFTLTYERSGLRAGLPLRIELQPRWWLRLRLEAQ